MNDRLLRVRRAVFVAQGRSSAVARDVPGKTQHAKAESIIPILPDGLVAYIVVLEVVYDEEITGCEAPDLPFGNLPFGIDFIDPPVVSLIWLKATKKAQRRFGRTALIYVGSFGSISLIHSVFVRADVNIVFICI